MEYTFRNKVVIVTGASSGIGEQIALLFAKHEALLSLVGRDENNLMAVVEQCEELSGSRPLAILADLATEEGCQRVATNTILNFGRIDILINNAGISCRSTLQTANMADFDQVFNLNVRSVYNLTRLVVQEIIKTKGNIVNISSISGTKVTIGSLPYSMTKAAINHFTRLTALELAPHGVRVNAVLPGFTVSRLVIRMTNYTHKEYKSWINEAKSVVPMGDVCLGEDIAYAVVHLASEYSRLVTGAFLTVDGGALYGDLGNILKKQLVRGYAHAV
ncbi:3-oxoacyl-[acyl-carrier-protein] reductase FabG-like [Amyelois transitella]|uniref:3-oxoacyl-[acyl-carrier-protein] reductase FabG-like n=1 Tax=Amyelois transitella TaxID=680683 RepID=UPI002990787A|nr:3-oxoacyl-[acyl-carrier-protein] reductase FabG-like [Amyelois transitella]